ncbi:MAG TPA: hypothetical protein VEK80_04880 [Kribbellaceae bacterium]|nr:hypothetical protein [Kribbellaceae bacterium]
MTEQTTGPAPLSGPDARALANTEVTLATGPPYTDGVVDRLEDAMLRIAAIADSTADELDRLSVLRMNETLRLLAGPPLRENPAPVLGLAPSDGSLMYDETHVTGPLRELTEQPGTRHDPAALRRYRYALAEMCHQNSHLLSAGGTSYGASREAFADPAVRLLEMGVTELWTARHLDEYIAALGMAEVAPGIGEVTVPVSYPAYVPAADTLTQGVGRWTGLTGDEVLRRLNGAAPAGKAPEAANLLLLSSGLANVVPPADRPAATARVVAALQAPLFVMATEDTTGVNEQGIMTASAAAGTMAVDAAVREINDLHREYGN